MPNNRDLNREMKILVVDDFPTQRKLIKRLLQSLGFENVVEAVDGVDAMEKLKVDPVEFIICDWNMPRMMGIELLREIRSDGGMKSLPFLMITAEARRENIIEAAKAGVSDYIAKPFTIESLHDKMKKIFLG